MIVFLYGLTLEKGELLIVTKKLNLVLTTIFLHYKKSYDDMNVRLLQIIV